MLLIFGLWVNSLPLHDEKIVIVTQDYQSQLERTVASQQALAISGGDGDGLPIWFSGKRKKFDLVLHTRLMKTFPDSEAQMNYQKKQKELYKLAIKKQSELKRLRISSGFYTKEELDAIDYFHGKGFYAKEQDPNVKPNMFDTRQSFLIKMHNPVMRKNFIKSLKRLNSLDESNSL